MEDRLLVELNDFRGGGETEQVSTKKPHTAYMEVTTSDEAAHRADGPRLSHARPRTCPTMTVTRGDFVSFLPWQ